MKTRASKALGVTAALTAIALSIPTAINAYADPPPEPKSTNDQVPDPQGSGCDAFKKALPNWKNLATQPVGTALASIPDLSTFNSAISGQLNPAVNIVPVLNNGPYVVFAPTNEAFAELPQGQLDVLKTDSRGLSDLVYYHAFLGLLGPDDVRGQRPTQQGAEVDVQGKGGDIKVNDAKVLCGAIQASNARIYLIDKVLDPANAPAPTTPSTSRSSSSSATTAASPSSPATPAADAPIG